MARWFATFRSPQDLGAPPLARHLRKRGRPARRPLALNLLEVAWAEFGLSGSRLAWVEKEDEEEDGEEDQVDLD